MHDRSIWAELCAAVRCGRPVIGVADPTAAQVVRCGVDAWRRWWARGPWLAAALTSVGVLLGDLLLGLATRVGVWALGLGVSARSLLGALGSVGAWRLWQAYDAADVAGRVVLTRRDRL